MIEHDILESRFQHAVFVCCMEHAIFLKTTCKHAILVEHDVLVEHAVWIEHDVLEYWFQHAVLVCCFQHAILVKLTCAHPALLYCDR